MDEGHFDFNSVSQEEEKLDFNKMLPCPKCKKPVPHDAITCYYCGEAVAFSKKSNWIIITATIIAVIFTLFILASV
jgi:RNA polymerase subunit RPABC4/transcription elongation factor Spt4